MLTTADERSAYAFKDEPIEIGIDEAGRGPVMGPMVYGLAFWPRTCGDEMRREFQFNDSKKLTEKQRDEMFLQLKEMDHSRLGWMVNVSDA